MADIIAGSAAESGQKALTCRAVGDAKEAGKSAVYACILAGGQKPIPNGPIAIVRYRVPREIRRDYRRKSGLGKSSGQLRT